MLSFLRVAVLVMCLFSVINTETVPKLGCCCDRPGHAVCWQNVDSGLGKQVKALSWAQQAKLVRAGKTVVLRAMRTTTAWPRRFQKRGPLIRGLETILAVLWQRMWLFSALAHSTPNLPDSKLKTFRLMALAEVISR